ncbi:hypothetical protein SAMN05192553_102786 [Cyclobacterium xiamenense]|uniref:Uncharacterized protein n=1 Tax=Cyclobacterium xiamenense TaxID=1297121 RepID=A0A1H6WYR8_9BACT|nr:hypothetical protein SAMN05192553_102786 [Cyclobacterium xiamenense]
MKNRAKYLIAGLVTAMLSLQQVAAQCAMCRATIENNVSNGDTTVGAGLNVGILYLFLAPYLLLSIIGYFWYKKAKQKKRFSLRS